MGANTHTAASWASQSTGCLYSLFTCLNCHVVGSPEVPGRRYLLTYLLAYLFLMDLYKPEPCSRPYLKGSCPVWKILSVNQKRTTHECVYLVALVWPWPWPDDLHIRVWPRYSEDVYQRTKNDVSRQKLPNVRAQTRQRDTQTDRQTDRRGQTHYHAALVVGGSKDDVITCFLLGTAWTRSRDCETPRGPW